MNLWLERHCPKLLAAGAFALAWFGLPHLHVKGNLEPLWSNAINLAGIAIGFLATAKAIVYSLGRNRLMKAYQALGLAHHLADYFMVAIYWSFTLAALSAVCLVFRAQATGQYKLALVSLWGAMLVGSLAAYFRILRILRQILRSPDK